MSRLLFRALAALGDIALFCLLAPLALIALIWERIARWRRAALIKHLYGGDAEAYDRDQWRHGS